MTTPFEDGAGYINGGDFVTIANRDAVIQTRLTGGAGRAVPGGTIGSTIDVGDFYSPRSNVPGWIYNPTTKEFYIPEAGTYEFAIRIALNNQAPSTGTVSYQISLSSVSYGAVSIITDNMPLGAGYTPDAARQVAIPGGYKWRFAVNVTSGATTELFMETVVFAQIRRVM